MTIVVIFTTMSWNIHFRNLPKLQNRKKLMDNIETLIKEIGLSKTELGKKIDLDKTAMSRLFTGERYLRYNEAYWLLEYLHTILSPIQGSAEEICTKKIIAVNEEEKLDKASKLMKDQDFTQIPVVSKKGKYTGLLTDEVIANAFLYPDAKIGKNWIEVLKNKKVGELKLDHPPTFFLTSSLTEVMLSLLYHYAIPLEDEITEFPVGIITRADVHKLFLKKH